MTKTAVYEQGEGAEALKLRSYNERPGKRRLNGIISGVAIYVLIAVIVFLAVGFDVFDFGTDPEKAAIAVAALAVGGIVFTVAYVIIIRKMIYRRYRNLRSSMVRYDSQKRKLLVNLQEGKAGSGLD